MNWKWLDRAYQFEDEPSGGGGEDPPEKTPEPDVSDVESGHVSHEIETRGDDDDDADDAAPETGGEGAADADDGEPAAPSPPAGATVAMPDDLGQLFRPVEAVSPHYQDGPSISSRSQPQGDPPAGEAAPPEKVDFPSGDLWLNDPEAAAEQNRKAIEYTNWASQQPLREEINTIKGHIQGNRRQQFEQIKARVQSAAGATEETVQKFYAEDGPFNSDPEFRNNPEVQAVVKQIVGGCLERALWAADEHGKTDALERISGDPSWPHVALAMAKAKATTPDPGLAPKASPAGQQPPSKDSGPRLSADERKALNAARASGSNVSAKQIADAKKRIAESVW